MVRCSASIRASGTASTNSIMPLSGAVGSTLATAAGQHFWRNAA